MEKIYLDNSATTEVDSLVAKYIYDTMLECYGNPSSLYDMGVYASQRLVTAAKQVAALIGAKSEEIYFTSGGTESNNWAIFGTALAKKRRGKRIVSTAFEHASIIEPLHRLQNEGFEVIFVKPNSDGIITAANFLANVNADTILASFMLVNNEVGTVLPYEEIAAGVKKIAPNATVHCDAVQAFGKLPIKIGKTSIDLLSMSGHKIHAPKGIGALYIKTGTRLEPIILGGSQQNKMRPGTQSLPLACGMGMAAALRSEKMAQDYEKVKNLNKYLLQELAKMDFVSFNSPYGAFEYITNISVVGIRSETMLHFLEEVGIYVSSASACTAGAASHVLQEMGCSAAQTDSALRISLNAQISNDDIDKFCKRLELGAKTLAKSRK